MQIPFSRFFIGVAFVFLGTAGILSYLSPNKHKEKVEREGKSYSEELVREVKEHRLLMKKKNQKVDSTDFST